jgi:hypothetical protein
MFRRFIAAARIDLLDARVAFEQRDWRYMLPACLFRRVNKSWMDDSGL